MLPQLEALLHASPKVVSFQVLDNDPIDEANFLFKIRCELTSGRGLQIRLHAIAGHVRYSYQELGDHPVRRWDNAPHFPGVPSFPHHHHDVHGTVSVSSLSGEPVADLARVLDTL
jgi:hypothetical protein